MIDDKTTWDEIIKLVEAGDKDAIEWEKKFWERMRPQMQEAFDALSKSLLTPLEWAVFDTFIEDDPTVMAIIGDKSIAEVIEYFPAIVRAQATKQPRPVDSARTIKLLVDHLGSPITQTRQEEAQLTPMSSAKPHSTLPNEILQIKMVAQSAALQDALTFYIYCPEMSIAEIADSTRYKNQASLSTLLSSVRNELKKQYGEQKQNALLPNRKLNSLWRKNRVR